jgi:hypothetical protein
MRIEVPKEKYKQMLYYLHVNISLTIASKQNVQNKFVLKVLLLLLYVI